jgi:hypothetical protein
VPIVFPIFSELNCTKFDQVTCSQFDSILKTLNGRQAAHPVVVRF